jgi:hypothetical protein
MNYHFEATISIEHDVSSLEPVERIQDIRRNLEYHIRYHCRFFCIDYKIEEFWHCPDERAESCGEKFLGTTIVLTRDLKLLKSYYYMANYLRSVLDLLILMSPKLWENAKLELL